MIRAVAWQVFTTVVPQLSLQIADTASSPAWKNEVRLRSSDQQIHDNRGDRKFPETSPES